MKLHTKYEGLALLVSDKNIFKSFAKLNVKIFDLSIKKVKVDQRYSFFISKFIGPMSPMPHTKPQAHWSFGSGEEDF